MLRQAAQEDPQALLELLKNTQEEPRDPLYPKQVGNTGGKARSCNPEEVKATGPP